MPARQGSPSSVSADSSYTSNHLKECCRRQPPPAREGRLEHPGAPRLATVRFAARRGDGARSLPPGLLSAGGSEPPQDPISTRQTLDTSPAPRPAAKPSPSYEPAYLLMRRAAGEDGTLCGNTKSSASWSLAVARPSSVRSGGGAVGPDADRRCFRGSSSSFRSKGSRSRCPRQESPMPPSSTVGRGERTRARRLRPRVMPVGGQPLTGPIR